MIRLGDNPLCRDKIDVRFFQQTLRKQAGSYTCTHTFHWAIGRDILLPRFDDFCYMSFLLLPQWQLHIALCCIVQVQFHYRPLLHECNKKYMIHQVGFYTIFHCKSKIDKLRGQYGRYNWVDKTKEIYASICCYSHLSLGSLPNKILVLNRTDNRFFFQYQLLHFVCLKTLSYPHCNHLLHCRKYPRMTHRVRQ